MATYLGEEKKFKHVYFPFKEMTLCYFLFKVEGLSKYKSNILFIISDYDRFALYQGSPSIMIHCHFEPVYHKYLNTLQIVSLYLSFGSAFP